MNDSFAETIYGDEFAYIFHKTIVINANVWAKNDLSDTAIFLTYMIYFTYTVLILEKATLSRSVVEYLKKKGHAKKCCFWHDIMFLTTE